MLTEDEYNRIASKKRGVDKNILDVNSLKGLSFTDTGNNRWNYVNSGRACVVMQRSGGVKVAAKIFVHEKENEKGKENEKEKEKMKEADYEGEFAEDVIEAPSAPARSQEEATWKKIHDEVVAEYTILRSDGLTTFVPRVSGYIGVARKASTAGTAPVTVVGYVMDKFDKSLLEHIQTTGGLTTDDEEKIYAVIEGVCQVVRCFDVKPANFVVELDSQDGDGSLTPLRIKSVRMIDFGCDFCECGKKHNAGLNAGAVLFGTLLFWIATCVDVVTSGPVRLVLPYLTEKLRVPRARETLVLIDEEYGGELFYQNALANVQGECFHLLTKSKARTRRTYAYSAADLLALCLPLIIEPEITILPPGGSDPNARPAKRSRT
jgi:hypothetical protein